MMWMGDQINSFDNIDGLKSSLTSILNAGISGFQYLHSDVGAFLSAKTGFGYDLIRTNELLIRWLELNTFSNTILRSHPSIKP